MFSIERRCTSRKCEQAFVEWEQQDQLLLSWMLSSISEKVLPRLVGYETSFQVWVKLEQYFASQIRIKIGQFKDWLKATKKGSLNVVEYLIQNQELC